MATKTTKTAARKTATASKTVKAAAPSSRSSTHAEAKHKEPAKEAKSAKAHAPAKVSKPAVTPAPEKPKTQTAGTAKPASKPVEAPKAAAPRNVESVSLIDEKKPKAKRPEGDGAVKRAAVLPPISRLRTPGPIMTPPAPPPP